MKTERKAGYLQLMFMVYYLIFIDINISFKMSKQEYDSHLKFGQGILIEGFKTEGQDKGFLTAQGFADIKAKYQTYDDILFFKNYRNSIFQILPAGNFELNDELQKSLIENQGEPDTSNIRILKARAQSQRVQFQLNIQANMTKKVCFGHNVIFKHIDSGSYVSGTIKPSTGSNGAFTVQVSQKLSESLVFKLMPYRSFQFIDMAIPFDSPILIRNQFNYGFLTYEKIGMGDQGKNRGTYIEKKPIESNDSYRIPIKTQGKKSEVYQIVTHFVDLSCEKEVPMPWRFKLHVNNVINDTLIQHDVVYLKHTENGGVLSTHGQDIILKELKDKLTEELCFYQCLWEIQSHSQEEGSAYILRHLMSGMVLGSQIGEDSIRRAVLQDISQGKEDKPIGFVEVQLAKKQGGTINSQSFVNIARDGQLLQISDQSQQLQESATKVHDPEAKIDLARMRSLYKREIEYNIRPLAFKKNITQQHCFVIMEIQDQLKRELLFAMSFHSVIIKLREDLQWGAIEAAKKIGYLRMMQVTTKIKEIKIFIKNCKEEQAQLQHIYPVYKRQMICKDLGISQLLFELLYFMKMNLKEDIFSDKHNERQKFLQLYNTLYQVINELVRNNSLFKMHISKWFQFILDDVINNNEPCQLNLLKQLLRDNHFFVNNFVNKEIITYLTSHYINKSQRSDKHYHEKKYLQIFRLFCIVGSTVNTHNQKLILDHFIKVLKESRSLYQVILLQQNSKIIISSSLDKTSARKYQFRQFYDKCKEENSSAWFYFVEYLNLIADLVQGRNKVTEMQLCNVFTLTLLGDLFENEDLYEAEVPVIRLLHYLYAQSEYFYPIQKKRKILNYNSLARNEDQISIHSTLSNIKPWEPPFNRVLQKLSNKLKEYKQSPISHVGEENYVKNQIILTLLKFLWETINLGFWHSKEKVKQLLTDVLNLLRKSDEISDYKDVMIESKENILMIQCKIQCLNIIDLIAAYDADVFVQFIASRFKDFQFPQKKFSLKGMFNNSPLLQIKCNHEMINKFLASLPSDDTIQPIIQTSIIDSMIELSNYNNAQLTSKAISIIDRVLQTRKKAFHQFSQLIIISQDQRIKLLQFMELHRDKFFLLDDSNIVNVSEDNQVCNYFMIYDQENLGLMEVMYLLTELMKNQNSILNVESIKSIHQAGIFHALGSNRLINFTGERSSTNRMKQEIVYSSNLHLKVLNFIFSCHQLPESELAFKLLHLSYYFIVSLIQNFNQIKSLLQWHIPKMIHHIKKNVGCIDFLKEMYDNNKTMLYNESAVFELIGEICQNIEREPEESYYKSKLLDFFRYLIYCNGRALKAHQIQILKIMQDDSYANIMIKIKETDIEQLVQQYEELNKESDEIIMSPKLTYICTFFQTLAALVDTSNKVNIGKLIKRYPFDTLVQFLIKSKNCWPLKRNLRCFINRLYYFHPEIDTQLKTILSKEMSNFIEDLNQYIENKHLPNIIQLQNKKFKNPVRFSYIQSYHYLLVEETIFAIFNLATRQSIMVEMVKYLNNLSKNEIQAAYNWFKIVQRLAWLQQFFTNNKNVYSNSLIKYILSKIKPLFLALQDKSIFEQGMGSVIGGQGSSAFNNSKQAFFNKLLISNIDKFFIQRNPAVYEDLPLTFLTITPQRQKIIKQRDEGRLKEVLRTIFRREKRDFQNEDERISYNLQQLISSLKLSPATQRYTLSQYNQKVQTYYLRQDKYEYISRIIELNTKETSALTSQRKIFFLQFITGLVEIANKPKENQHEADVIQEAPPEEEEGEKEDEGGQFKKDIDQWDAEDWSENKEQIEETQKNLKKCQLGKFIVQLLKQDIINNIQLANSILLCSISYLLGGNTITQKDIIEQLQKDTQNKVFQNIEALIQKLGVLIKKNIVEANQSQQDGTAEFEPNTVDNYDYYDAFQRYTLRKNVFQPNSTDQYLYNKLCITTYRRAFKFLQLLCQNDNKEGKNFIRTQPQKAKQYNFIDITTKQLRNLFHIFCNEIKEVPLFLLDFILQVTQIPIYQNQNALMSSTFFEDLCQLKTLFSEEKIITDRGFKSRQHVQAIFYKSFKIILSNFEGNDVKTFEAVDSKLESKFLIEILYQKLKSMGIESQADFVKHIKTYSNKDDDNGDKNTGFDQDVLILLDIVTIFLKLRDNLGEKSRIFAIYQRTKKDQLEAYKQKLWNECSDRGITDENELQAAVDDGVKSYKCGHNELQKCLLKIQITDDKGKDQYIYFPKYPVFKSLADNLRNYIMKQVQRSSHRDKIVTLLSFTEGIKQKMEYSYNLQKKKKITEQHMKDSFQVASYLSIIICAYITFFYHIAVQYQQAEFYSEISIGLIRFVLSFFQLTFTVLYVFYWFELKLWFNPEPISRGETKVEEQPASTEDQPYQLQIEESPKSKLQMFMAIYRKGEAKVRDFLKVVKQQLQTEQQRIYKNIQLWRIFIFLSSSVLGTFYFPPLFFLHLIDIFAQIDKLGTILLCVIYNGYEILLVSVMGVFFSFIFCTVTFSNYMKNLYSAADQIEDMCDNVMKCVIQLYISGVIGQTMEQFEIMRFIYDIIYFTFFEMLFGNIVSGLMIDAFSSLRETADSLQQDKKNKCYICDISRQSLEKQGDDFEQHTKQKHFLWNYIFYIYVLQQKDQTDYTGLQYYIKQQYNLPNEQMEVSWIPNKGESQFAIQQEAQKLSDQLKVKLEETGAKSAALQEQINEFRQIASEYIE